MSHIPKAVIINPPQVLSPNTISFPAVPPLTIAYLIGALLEKKIPLKVIDAIGEAVDSYYQMSISHKKYIIRGLIIEELISTIPKDVANIFISCSFTLAWPFINILTTKIKTRFPRVPIIIGGEHASALHRHILEHYPSIDVCVCGEGEETIQELALSSTRDDLHQIKGISFRQDGKVLTTMPRSPIDKIEEIARPAWEYISIEKYFNSVSPWSSDSNRSLPLLTSRGCRYNCYYCTKEQHWGRSYRIRSPEDVLDEIKNNIKKFDIKHFNLCDLSPFLQAGWLEKFCALLHNETNVTWGMPIGCRTEILNKENIELLAKSGCTFISLSSETGSKKTQSRINRKQNLNNFYEIIKLIKKKKILLKIHFIIGLPGETRNDILQTLLLALKCARHGADDNLTFTYMDFPGTKFFNDIYNTEKKLDNRYYYSLLGALDVTIASSSNENISDREIRIWRILILLLSYLTGYLFHPSKFLSTLSFVFFGKKGFNSILDTRIRSILKRKMGKNV